MLLNDAIIYDHVIINNFRYYTSTRTPGTSDSLIAVRNSASPASSLWVGELMTVFSVKVSFTGGEVTHHFGHVRWFKSSPVDLQGTVWALL